MTIDAIILRAMPWREHDVRVVLYAREIGKCSAVARGACRAASRQSPALDAGTLIRCHLVSGRGGYIMTGAQCLRSWSDAQTSSFRLVALSFFLEAVDVLVYDSQSDEDVWQCLIGGLEALDQASEETGPALLRHWQGELFAVLGYGRPTAALNDAYQYLAERPLAALTLLRNMAGGEKMW